MLERVNREDASHACLGSDITCPIVICVFKGYCINGFKRKVE